MILIALFMGLAGSLHCVGMCSPLMMTVTGFKASAFLNRVVYNSGRILMYGMMGLSVGSAGALLPLSNYQNYLSIALGAALLVFAWRGSANIKVPLVSKLLQTINLKFKTLFGHFIQRKTIKSVFVLGILNGLLPCGLTFVALSYTIALGNPLDAFYFMLLFGVGTLPAMLGFTSLSLIFIKKYHFDVKPVFKTLVIISGFILIARVFIPHHHNESKRTTHDEIVVCGKR
jgi:sulfite exporter TauE/SafE